MINHDKPAFDFAASLHHLNIDFTGPATSSFTARFSLFQHPTVRPRSGGRLHDVANFKKLPISTRKTCCLQVMLNINIPTFHRCSMKTA